MTSPRHSVRVEPAARYLADQSDSEALRYVFGYVISLRNNGNVAVKLISRHWYITDGHGNTEEVEGDGVVGEQPVLEPGEGFTYSSGAILRTPVGSMYGYYHMVDAGGEAFRVDIPEFALVAPGHLN